MRELFAGPFKAERELALEHAAVVREHRFRFFGREFRYGQEIDWHADPVSKRRWPELYHADVPVHRGDVGFGDVKYVWELSRQQYLIDLAKAYFLTGSIDDLRRMRSLVRSWIAGNPYGTGVNWACALEPAFRVWSWLWAYHLTAPALDEDFHLEWLTAFYDHARFLERHLERYSSPYNHLIGEAAALYALGICFPEFQQAGRWAAAGRSVLNHRIHQQFYSDGGSVEQSAFYHHATTGFCLLAGLLARANGDDLSNAAWAIVEKALSHAAVLTQPDGRTPAIGGADDGKPILLEHLPLWDFRPYQAVGAVLFSRPDLKFVAGRFHEDALWLLGREGLDRFDALDAEAPFEQQLLPASGYAVMRSDWSASADYVCFDCGEQAAGIRTDSVPNSMHGHADCLSVICWLNGRKVLVDSGFYSYNCGGVWESHFRETAAHNTARIDARDQARHLGKMAWSCGYRASLEAFAPVETQRLVTGSHDGYARGAAGVTHRRAVSLQERYILICDEFTGNGEHDIEVNFQFAPGELRLELPGAVFSGFVDIVWTSDAFWDPVIRCGGSEPTDGWIAPSLGVRQAAPRLTLRTHTLVKRVSLLTVLAARTRVEARPFIDDGDKRPVASRLIAIAGDDHIDWVSLGTTDPSAPIQTDGQAVVFRQKRGAVAERLRVGGTFARFAADVPEGSIPAVSAHASEDARR